MENYMRWQNHIGCVMVSVLAEDEVDHGVKCLSGQTQNYKCI